MDKKRIKAKIKLVEWLKENLILPDIFQIHVFDEVRDFGDNDIEYINDEWSVIEKPNPVKNTTIANYSLVTYDDIGCTYVVRTYEKGFPGMWIIYKRYLPYFDFYKKLQLPDASYLKPNQSEESFFNPTVLIDPNNISKTDLVKKNKDIEPYLPSLCQALENASIVCKHLHDEETLYEIIETESKEKGFYHPSDTRDEPEIRSKMRYIYGEYIIQSTRYHRLYLKALVKAPDFEAYYLNLLAHCVLQEKLKQVQIDYYKKVKVEIFKNYHLAPSQFAVSDIEQLNAYYKKLKEELYDNPNHQPSRKVNYVIGKYEFDEIEYMKNYIERTESGITPAPNGFTFFDRRINDLKNEMSQIKDTTKIAEYEEKILETKNLQEFYRNWIKDLKHQYNL